MIIDSFNKILHSLRVDLYFLNDLHDVDQMRVLQKVKVNTQFSFSFVLLLISSTIVCSLGLLLNSAPIIIGGMIISPLMWPLMKIAVGVSFERKSFITQALHLLLLSIFVILVSSFFITFLSPIKLVSTEITARTNPTLLDVIVAIAAGAIAAFAIAQKKISDSLAGVAIATSLMPPLCVSGIGFALHEYQIATGGFLLFFANVVSIIFISVLIFVLVGIKRNSKQSFRHKGILVVAIILLLTSLPLLYLLQSYSFKTRVYQESQDAIKTSLSNISPLITVENIKTDLKKIKGEDTIFIEADVTIPEDITLDYQQKDNIIKNLEDTLHKKVDFNLRIQKTVALKSESDIKNNTTKNRITQIIRQNLEKFNDSMKVTSIDIREDPQDQKWNVFVTAQVNPAITITDKDRGDIQDIIQKQISQPVSLDLSLIPWISLKSQPDLELEKIRQDIGLFIGAISLNIQIKSISIEKSGTDGENSKLIAVIHVEHSSSENIPGSKLDELKELLQKKYNQQILLRLITVETKISER